MLKAHITERSENREDRVDPMWLLDSNDERRLAIYRRAAAAARKALDAH